jgi:hypothetical protein
MNAYEAGTMLAQLNNSNFQSSWLSGQSLGLINRAFKIYYDARRRGLNATGRLSTNLLNDLSSAAREGVGYGMYSGDLLSVFQTLAKNKGQWNENSWENYNGPQTAGAWAVPVGVCNFLKAVDWRAETLQKSYASVVSYVREAKAAKSMNRWAEIGTYTENLGKVLENSEPYLWLSPKIVEDGHGKLGGWTDAFSIFYSFLENFNKFNVDLRMGKVPAAVASGFIAVVSKAVPIFGDVYGKALETIPALVKWAQNIRDERENMIRQIIGPSYSG